ncbi:unnamed protein product [Pseudo-nitzschia multistriata]|uniref:non-specific serine/threonine protein kinase n=1 Tax=Pseudo-nitzschia multistriata TaxID=183589 RepID=A0A448ZMR0_9STRA|nr:unnamed protein product [Pseudo-nitzschia multistriata]
MPPSATPSSLSKSTQLGSGSDKTSETTLAFNSTEAEAEASQSLALLLLLLEINEGDETLSNLDDDEDALDIPISTETTDHIPMSLVNGNNLNGIDAKAKPSFLVICTVDGYIMVLNANDGSLVYAFSSGIPLAGPSEPLDEDIFADGTRGSPNNNNQDYERRIVPFPDGQLYDIGDGGMSVKPLGISVQDILANPAKTCWKSGKSTRNTEASHGKWDRDVGNDGYDDASYWDDNINNNELDHIEDKEECGIVTATKSISLFALDSFTGNLVWHQYPNGTTLKMDDHETAHGDNDHTNPNASSSGRKKKDQTQSTVLLQREDVVVQQISTDNGEPVWNVTWATLRGLEFGESDDQGGRPRSPRGHGSGDLLPPSEQGLLPTGEETTDGNGFGKDDCDSVFSTRLPDILFSEDGTSITAVESSRSNCPPPEIMWTREFPKTVASVFGLNGKSWEPLTVLDDVGAGPSGSWNGEKHLLPQSSNNYDDNNPTDLGKELAVIKQQPSHITSHEFVNNYRTDRLYHGRDFLFRNGIRFPFHTQRVAPTLQSFTPITGGRDDKDNRNSFVGSNYLQLPSPEGYSDDKTQQKELSVRLEWHIWLLAAIGVVSLMKSCYRRIYEQKEQEATDTNAVRLQAMPGMNEQKQQISVTQPTTSDSKKEERTATTKTSTTNGSPKVDDSTPHYGVGLIDGSIPLIQYTRYASEFEEIGALGKGGFGSVFQCRNPLDKRDYAIKKVLIRSDSKQPQSDFTNRLKRTLREVKSLASLDHSNIVRYYTAWLEREQLNGGNDSENPSDGTPGASDYYMMSYTRTSHVKGFGSGQFSESVGSPMWKSNNNFLNPFGSGGGLPPVFDHSFSTSSGQNHSISEVPEALDDYGFVFDRSNTEGEQCDETARNERTETQVISRPQSKSTTVPSSGGGLPPVFQNSATSSSCQSHNIPGVPDALDDYGFVFDRNSTEDEHSVTSATEESLKNQAVPELKSAIKNGTILPRNKSRMNNAISFQSLRSSRSSIEESTSEWSQESKNQSDATQEGNESNTIEEKVAEPTVSQKYILYIQMQFCSQKTLADFLSNEEARRGPSGSSIGGIDIPYALSLFLQTCQGVKHVHSKGLIHRDLKPNNIFIDDDGAVKVGDFGLSRASSDSNKGDGEADSSVVVGSTNNPSNADITAGVGTRSYASPEQMKGGSDYDSSTDIYSLGIILFELCYPMYTGMERNIVLSNLRNHILPNLWTETVAVDFPRLNSLVLSMISNKPKDRPTAQAVVEQIQSVLEGFTISSLDKRDYEGSILLRVEIMFCENGLHKTMNLLREAALPNLIDIVQYGLRSSTSKGQMKSIMEFAIVPRPQQPEDEPEDAPECSPASIGALMVKKLSEKTLSEKTPCDNPQVLLIRQVSATKYA